MAKFELEKTDTSDLLEAKPTPKDRKAATAIATQLRIEKNRDPELKNKAYPKVTQRKERVFVLLSESAKDGLPGSDRGGMKLSDRIKAAK